MGDALLIWFLYLATADWPVAQAKVAMCALAGWMVFSKFIKLITHFVRYPVDILLWPISVFFGWFHGGIKYYALATLSEVCIILSFQLSETYNSIRRPGVAVLEQMQAILKE